MRSRYSHDGSLDHHADNEHDLFRRADEALERQRQAAHAAKAVEQATLGTTLSPLKSGIASPLGAGQPSMGSAVPKMPHEELAERFALKSATTPTSPARGRRIR